jgi:flagellar basal-body rod protein FlgB
MQLDLSILRVAGALGRHAAQRHSLIAENIANADTPGFRAKDLEPFAAALRRLDAGGGEKSRPRELTITLPGATSPNGNAVSLEDQMLRAGQASRANEIATTIFTKTIAMLRAAAARPR